MLFLDEEPMGRSRVFMPVRLPAFPALASSVGSTVLSHHEVTHLMHQCLKHLLPSPTGIIMKSSDHLALKHKLLTPRPKHLLSEDVLHPMRCLAHTHTPHLLPEQFNSCQKTLYLCTHHELDLAICRQLINVY